MPVIKVSKEQEEPKRFKWAADDKFVVANWQNNTTIAHFVGDELFEIVGTEKEPVTYKELRQYSVDVDAFFMAGQLGVFREGNYVFYKDTYEQFDDSYFEEPPQVRGFSYQNRVLHDEKRIHKVEDEKPNVIDPAAVPVIQPGDELREKYAANQLA